MGNAALVEYSNNRISPLVYHCKNMTVALTNMGYLTCNQGDRVCYGIPLEIHGDL